MKNFWLSVLLGICFGYNGFTQIVDVYNNKIYEVATSSFTLDEEKDYLSESESVYLDLPVEENRNFEKIGNQLKERVVESLENEIKFFQLHQSAIRQLEIFKEIAVDNREQYQYEYSQPEFQNVRINLISIINSFAVYQVDYDFEANNLSDSRTTKRLKLKKFYLANLKTSQVGEIAKKPNSAQQKILREISLNHIRKLYLLKTKKIDLDAVERIRSFEDDNTQDQGFFDKIDFSEALVYPYGFGVMVEFPKYSETSKIFDGEAFRVFIRGGNLENLIEVFPTYKSVFAKKVNPASPETENKLSDQIFNLSYLRQGPENEEVLRLFDFEKKVYSLKIETIDNREEIQEVLSTKTFRYNQSDQLERIEHRGSDKKLYEETKFSYNPNGKLISEIKISNNRREPIIYYYDKGNLLFSERFNLNSYGNPHNSNKTSILEMWQTHHFSNSNYVYRFRINSFGEIKNNWVDTRWLEEKKRCSLSSCLIFDEENNLVGVQSKRQDPIEILNNSDGQVLESYSDRGRDRYFFKYDLMGRLTKMVWFRDDKLHNSTIYEYGDTSENPLIILKSKENRKEVYHVEFWE